MFVLDQSQFLHAQPLYHLSTNFVGGEVQWSLQRHWGEGADRASRCVVDTVRTGIDSDDSAVAPSPEQRL